MKRISLIDKAFILKRTPLFAMLDLDLLLSVGDKLGIAEYNKSDVVFKVNEEAHRMYFIVKGKVQISDKKGQVVANLEAEDFFGDEALFNDKPRGYSALCMEESTLLTLSRTNLLTIISECPSVAVGLLQVYSSPVSFRARKVAEVEI